MHTYFYILLLTTNCWTKKENFSKCTKCCHYANFDKSLCAPAPVYVYFSQNCILITIHYSLCTMNEGHLPWLTCGEQFDQINHPSIQTFNFRVKMCIECTFLCHLIIFVFQPLPEHEEKLIESLENTSQIETGK